MRWQLLVCVVALGACGGDSPECGTSMAEALFIETALDAYDHAFGPPAQATGSCPGGGTSIVEGTSGPSATSPRVDDYKVTFQACATLDQKLTFNGVVQLKATWTGVVDAAYCDDCKLTSDSLMIRGTEDHCDEPHIDRTCKVSFTVTGTAPNVPQTYDGKIC
ncbi:MAG TPA: hypothetical protein VL326_22835, partial [Kofleriaceae bacterium]|nr:hypothetical protein [Kofleriaceae bacterium]